VEWVINPVRSNKLAPAFAGAFFYLAPMSWLLETERLGMRPFKAGDEPLIYELNRQPLIVRYTGNPPMSNLEEAYRVLHEHLLPQYALGLGRWAVFLKADLTFIGWCGLKQTESGVDFGYRYLSEYWGQGYGTEAARAVVTYAFETLKLPVLQAHAVVENQASIRILERMGMQKKERVQQPHRTIQPFELRADQYQANQTASST
jgi:RimJ/RimL family protein N-acetyltransferase